jgi:CRISPR-associated protein Csb1
VNHAGEIDFERALLVESAQSMANHLEAVGWDGALQRPVDALAGLPYMRVVDAGGRYLTSSRTEAHRLASAFVKDSTWDGRPMVDVIRERLELQDDVPLAPRAIAGAIMRLDPLCLVHGVFFAESSKVWPGQPKVARALTAFIEARDVHEAVSGGVKRDEVRHSVAEGGGTAEGYGNVPFHRVEWTAAEIEASFVVDLAQFAAYGLPEPGADLLTAIARWEIRTLLDGGLRLRTACDLVPAEDLVVDTSGAALPSGEEAAAELRRLMAAAGPLLGDGEPIEVVWGGSRKGKRTRPSAEPALTS